MCLLAGFWESVLEAFFDSRKTFGAHNCHLRGLVPPVFPNHGKLFRRSFGTFLAHWEDPGEPSEQQEGHVGPEVGFLRFLDDFVSPVRVFFGIRGLQFCFFLQQFGSKSFFAQILESKSERLGLLKQGCRMTYCKTHFS